MGKEIPCDLHIALNSPYLPLCSRLLHKLTKSVVQLTIVTNNIFVRNITSFESIFCKEWATGRGHEDHEIHNVQPHISVRKDLCFIKYCSHLDLTYPADAECFQGRVVNVHPRLLNWCLDLTKKHVIPKLCSFIEEFLKKPACRIMVATSTQPRWPGWKQFLTDSGDSRTMLGCVEL